MNMYEEALNIVESKARARNPETETDYRSEDGILHCGICNAPKETRLTIFNKERLLPIPCQCEKERMAKEKEENERREKEDRIRRLKGIGLTDASMAQKVFANDDHGNPEMSEVCRNYADNFVEMKKMKKGLLLFGPVGTGKTFLATCIANQLLDEGHACLVTNFAKLCNKMQAYREDRNIYLESLNEFELLVIDDLAAERKTEYMEELIYTIIDSRYRSGLPIIVTTNMTADELKYAADVRKQRINSRLMEMCMIYEVKGDDRRVEKFAEDYIKIREILEKERTD